MTKKLYIAIFLLIILSAATAAVIFATQVLPPQPVLPGVSVGDEFTYDLKGFANVIDLEASVPEYFYQFNNTEYYKVVVMGINGSEVSLQSTWRFTNGTEILYEHTIDISNGMKTREDGFWAIYAPDLTVGSKLRPYGADGVLVNRTDTKTYKEGSRETNYFPMENQFFDIRDPTYSTQRYDVLYVYFDKKTGILTELTNLQFYNNPQMTLTISWKIVNSNLWEV